MVRVAGALIAASPEDNHLAEQMQGWLNAFRCRAGQRSSPLSTQTHRPNRFGAVAAGITGIYFNVEALYPLGDVEALSSASERAAFLLLATLEGGNMSNTIRPPRQAYFSQAWFEKGAR